MEYKELGVLPSAHKLPGALGGPTGRGFSRAELIEKSAGQRRQAPAFQHGKAALAQCHYIKEKSPGELVSPLRPFLAARGYPEKEAPYLAGAIRTLQPRSRTMVEMADAMRFYMVEEVEFDEAAAKKFLTPEMRGAFERLTGELEKLEQFNEASLEEVFKRSRRAQQKLGKIAHHPRALQGDGNPFI